MAEARREEEEEGERRDLRDVRSRIQAAGLFGNTVDDSPLMILIISSSFFKKHIFCSLKSKVNFDV